MKRFKLKTFGVAAVLIAAFLSYCNGFVKNYDSGRNVAELSQNSDNEYFDEGSAAELSDNSPEAQPAVSGQGGAQVSSPDSRRAASTGAISAPDGLELPALRNASGEQILRRVGYTTSYNSETRLPNWVAWHLTSDHTNGPYKRNGIDFADDNDVPEPRATDRDYYRSGYDRGHMCPSGDNKWSEQAQRESFLFTNICPQNHNLNAGDWNEMEMQCRRWADKYGELYIVCGPILYNQKHKTIGRNRVVVPEAFFKVVLRPDGDSFKAIGFVYKNAEGNRPKGDYVNSVDQVERITGLDFFPSLPDDIEAVVEAEANARDWGL